MSASTEHEALVALVAWIDQNTSGITLPNDERSLIASGCFDVAIEHQAAIALLHSAKLYGAMFALLRVLSESLVRGLWLQLCATPTELHKFKNGKVEKKFGVLVKDVEHAIGTPGGILSGFKLSAWSSMNEFTHTGFIQVARRHQPGKIEANYPEQEIEKALGVAGALGLIAAGILIQMSDRQDLLPKYFERMDSYAKKASTS
jgi:hypothetical protein